MAAMGRWDIRVSGCKFPNRRTGLSALIATVNISTTQIIYKPELAVFLVLLSLDRFKAA
jgi:hypothetical protein